MPFHRSKLDAGDMLLPILIGAWAAASPTMVKLGGNALEAVRAGGFPVFLWPDMVWLALVAGAVALVTAGRWKGMAGPQMVASGAKVRIAAPLVMAGGARY